MRKILDRADLMIQQNTTLKLNVTSVPNLVSLSCRSKLVRLNKWNNKKDYGCAPQPGQYL